MAAYTKTTPGAPVQGFYTLGDVVTDSLNVAHVCTKTGFAAPIGAMVGNAATFAATPSVVTAGAYASGAAAGTGSSAVETVSGPVHKTVLTLADLAVNVADATQYGGTKIYDFPEERILVLGCVATLTPKTTTAIASTINSGVAGAIALGRVTASAISLTGTMADLTPSTAIVTSTTINVAAAAVTPVLAAAAAFDGTSTAIDMFLNCSITTATDIDADGTIAFGGTITFHWLNLGDL